MGEVAGHSRESWVLQKRFVAGSDFVLLAREAQGRDLAARLTVLQRRSPRRRVRENDGTDSWTIRYRAVESRAELLALARRMLREEPLGRLELVEDENEEGPDAETSDPSN